MSEVQQVISALDNLAKINKQNALQRRDEVIAEQTMLRNRWRGKQCLSLLFNINKGFLILLMWSRYFGRNKKSKRKTQCVTEHC